MLIRPRTQHAKCSICIRHKLVLQQVRRNVAARRVQMQLYGLHLEKQYQDRCRYWQNRADSRSKHREDDCRTITVTIDSMDHQKFMFPRDPAMGSKSFSGFIRPCLSVTSVIVHGYAFLTYISEPRVQHDSSWSVDCLSHAINYIQEKNPDLDLRSVHLKVHGDNSSKELKNNSCCRWLGGLCLARRIRTGELNCLQSGHSHEDIDQTFSGLASFIQSCPSLHVPDDYLHALKRWVSTEGFRPHEPFKDVFKVDQNRAWCLGF